jgi:V8-like Glu-specific endopeptidase
VVAAAALASVACGSRVSVEPDTRTEHVINGDDDRVEAFAVDDPSVRKLAEERAMAIVWDNVPIALGDTIALRSPTLKEAMNLCEGEPFADQPAAAACSGLLFEADLVLTASHCTRNVPCASMRIVRRLYYQSEGLLAPLTPGDVYRCSEVVASALPAASSAERVDYAWIRLDRAVAPLEEPPIPIRDAATALVVGEPLTMFGFPGGIPLKIDQGARVTDARSELLDYFASTTDSFYGSSGSPIFDVDGWLVGIQSRGANDFVLSESGCNVVARTSGEPTEGVEQATYAFRALDGLCERADAMSCSDDGSSTLSNGGGTGSGCVLASLPTQAGLRDLIAIVLALVLTSRRGRAERSR